MKKDTIAAIATAMTNSGIGIILSEYLLLGEPIYSMVLSFS